jgi:hypothetical protein
MMARRWPLRLRNLQTLAELGVEKNTTVMFPSPMMSAIGQISSFRTRETTAAQGITPPPATAKPSALPAPTHNQLGAGQRRGLWDRGTRASDRSTNG